MGSLFIHQRALFALLPKYLDPLFEWFKGLLATSWTSVRLPKDQLGSQGPFKRYIPFSSDARADTWLVVLEIAAETLNAEGSPDYSENARSTSVASRNNLHEMFTKRERGTYQCTDSCRWNVHTLCLIFSFGN